MTAPVRYPAAAWAPWLYQGASGEPSYYAGQNKPVALTKSSPRFSSQDSAYMVLPNVVQARQLGLSPSIVAQLPNLAHIFRGEFRRRMRFPVAHLFGVHLPERAALPQHILQIVGLGSEEQVVNTDTCWSIARVTDEHPIRDRSVFNLPCKSVAIYLLLGRSRRANTENAISTRPILGPDPQPACWRLFDPCPESLGRGGWYSHAVIIQEQG